LSDRSVFDFFGDGDNDFDLSESDSESRFFAAIAGDTARFDLLTGEVERALLDFLGVGDRDALSLESLEYNFVGNFDAFCVGLGDAFRVTGLGLVARPRDGNDGDSLTLSPLLMFPFFAIEISSIVGICFLVGDIEFLDFEKGWVLGFGEGERFRFKGELRGGGDGRLFDNFGNDDLLSGVAFCGERFGDLFGDNSR